MKLRRPLKDIVFFYSLVFPSLIMVLIIILLFYSQFKLSLPIFEVQGIRTYIGTRWSPSYVPPPEGGRYELLPAILGSLYTAIIAIIVSFVFSLSIVAFINELAPKSIRKIYTGLLDIMAGLPSIIYGVWGLYFLAPMMRTYVYERIYSYLGFLPTFSCYPLSGANIMTAGLLLGIMVTPFMVALLDEAYKNVPAKYIEAMYGIGMTLYEQVKTRFSIIKGVVVSSLLLGFGRAAGETAAVTLVIGNVYTISACVFSPAYTISSLIVNQFTESQDYPYMLNSLFAGSLILLIIGLVINTIGVILLKKVRL